MLLQNSEQIQKIVQTLSENFPISYSCHFIDLDENLQIIYLEK